MLYFGFIANFIILFIYFRFVEKGNLEVMLFDIQTKLRANNQRTYVPPEGKMIADINKVCARRKQSGWQLDG